MQIDALDIAKATLINHTDAGSDVWCLIAIGRSLKKVPKKVSELFTDTLAAGPAGVSLECRFYGGVSKHRVNFNDLLFQHKQTSRPEADELLQEPGYYEKVRDLAQHGIYIDDVVNELYYTHLPKLQRTAPGKQCLVKAVFAGENAPKYTSGSEYTLVVLTGVFPLYNLIFVKDIDGPGLCHSYVCWRDFNRVWTKPYVI